VIDSPTEGRNSYSLAVVAVGAALVVLFAGAGVIVAVNRQVPQELWAAASALSGALVGILIPTPGRTPPGAGDIADAVSVTQVAASNAARAAAAPIVRGAAQPAHSRQAAKAAVAAVRAAPIAAKVQAARATGTPAEVIDDVIGIFAAQLHEAQVRVQAAQNAAAAGPQPNGPDAAGLQTEVEQANANQTIHAAAAAAATHARGAAAAIAGGAPRLGAAAPKLTRQTFALIMLAAFVLLLALVLALLISSGTIHAAGCPIAAGGKTQNCDSNLLQVGTAVLALASAAGGTLLGLFATPDGKPMGASAAS
jgi:hypothetical protein